jgi:hypothetical protein
MRPSQTYQPLLSVVFVVILSGKHGAVERFHAVLSTFSGVVAHALIIVYAIILLGKVRAGYGSVFLAILPLR